LEISEGALKIRLEKGNGAQSSVQPAVSEQTYIPEVKTDSQTAKVEVKNEAPVAKAEDKIEEDCKLIKAPMVGAYHNFPGDNIRPGSKLKKGDRVCIIEAMKLMNEITMEEDGEILSMEMKEGEMVEYGQILIKYK
jgi:acetyl-CoA carboxylase biotin carboxyl carrier protein